MTCDKCGYRDSFEAQKFGYSFCRVCATFLPSDKKQIKHYVKEKIDWKILETFRKQTPARFKNQFEGMENRAEKGKLVTRPPLGYDVKNGKLIPNERALQVHRIFADFSKGSYSMNALAKKNGLSVNGIKKILKNRTYLGEIKFAQKTYKGNHSAIIDQDLFEVVQRLRSTLRLFS